ncbi:hypothetical protein ACSDR0_37000 [Streptosporangium sp. G11]|uniref:hypothetical protein n=1 Tax=Streptosporangium sp. G11 TaxID=3436926 RepID=UPI003EB9FAA8
MGQRLGEGWETLPPELLDAYDRWHLSTGYDTTLVRWLEGGMSEAPVALVAQFEPHVTSRQAVLKFMRDGPEAARRTRRALDHSPAEFRAAHLVELIGEAVPLDGWWMIQMEIAGGDRSTVRPLLDLLHRGGLTGACAVVTESVLGGWNPALAHRPLRMTAGAYLRSLLGDRLRPGSALSRWAAANGTAATVRWVPDGDGGQGLNPLALASGDESISLLVQRGRAHGDLNVRNVLLRGDDPRGFRLIDFGDFADDAPLARDPAHLLLSLAREWLGDLAVGSSARHALMVAVVTPGKSQAASVAGAKEAGEAFHDTAQRWADGTGFGEHWRLQALLSLIGCALIFTGRARLPDDVRRWFFDLAVYGTREYRRLARDLGEPQAPMSGRPGTSRPELGVPRSRAEIDAQLTKQMPFMQRTMGNKNGLVGTALELLDERERFVCLAPCRIRGGTPGSAVILVSDRYVRTAELDTQYQTSGVTRVAHGEIRELCLYPDRRLGLLDTADVRVATDTIELLARGLLRNQAEFLVASLEKLTGLRRREAEDGSVAAAWRDLVDALRDTRFEDGMSGDLAAGIESLRTALRRRRPPHPRNPDEVEGLVRHLNEILSGAASHAPPEQVSAARSSARLIRGRLLDLLTEARP